MQFRLSHIFIFILVLSQGLALYVAFRKERDLSKELLVLRDKVPDWIDIERNETQIVTRHNLVLPNGEGYDEFEVFLPNNQKRWAYLIAANDESFGPLTGHFIVESRRRIDSSGKYIEWHVRAWRYGNNYIQRGDLIGEATGLAVIEQTPLDRVRCSMWDKSARVYAGESNAPVVWSIYLYDKPNATMSELRMPD